MSHIVEFNVTGLAANEKAFGRKLHRDVNIFFGVNGSGKTSLLRILHSALSGDASLVANVPFRRAEVVIESLQFKRKFKHILERPDESRKSKGIKLDEFEDALFELEGSEEFVVRKDGRLQRRRIPALNWKVEPALPAGASGSWEHRFLPTSRLISRGVYDETRIDAGEDFYDTYFARDLERHWNGFFGGVQAEVRRIQEQGIANILSELLSAKQTAPKSSSFDWEKAYDRANAFLKRQGLSSALPTKKVFEERFKESPVLQRVVERIDALEDQILRAMEKRTKLQSLVERLFSGGKRLVLGDTSVAVHGKNDAKIGLQSLSSGEKHILRILFEVMSAGQSSLIIDEPELSLHIDWQRELINSIMELNPHLQLIVATHSPEMMAEIDDSKIFEFPS